jgi:hypothetical protein
LFAESLPGFFPEREHHRLAMLIAIMAVATESGSNEVFGEELKSCFALLLFCDAKQD